MGAIDLVSPLSTLRVCMNMICFRPSLTRDRVLQC